MLKWVRYGGFHEFISLKQTELSYKSKDHIILENEKKGKHALDL